MRVYFIHGMDFPDRNQENKMKSLKLTNIDGINAELTSVEHKCSTCLLSYDDIKNIIAKTEVRLVGMGIAKTNLRGSRFVYENGHKMTASYNGRPESTHLTFERNSKEWIITNIYRGDCNHNREVSFLNEDSYKHFYKF
jgi:hypothetical protein